MHSITECSLYLVGTAVSELKAKWDVVKTEIENSKVLMRKMWSEISVLRDIAKLFGFQPVFTNSA